MSAAPQAAAARVDDYVPTDVRDDGARIRAHRNESAAPIPQPILAALRSLSGDDLRRYPAARYSELARVTGGKLGVGSDAMLFANGSDDLILALAAAYVQEGTNVIVARPTFSMYGRATRLYGGTVREVPLDGRRRIDGAALVRACDEATRLVFIAHPHNPTGEPLARGIVKAVLARASRALVVVDEAYLSSPDASYFPDVARYDNLAVIATLSKIAGLAGLRCGYGAAAPAAARAVRRVMQPHPLSAPALIALKAYFEYVYGVAHFQEAYAQAVAASLDRIADALCPFALRVTRGDANFIVLEFGERGARVAGALKAAGIAARAIDAPEFDGALRISALCERETEELIDVVTSSLSTA